MFITDSNEHISINLGTKYSNCLKFYCQGSDDLWRHQIAAIWSTIDVMLSSPVLPTIQRCFHE